MVTNNQIKNWIIIAIQQEMEDQSELFYFDKKGQEFFSILTIDLFLFDKNLNIIEDISLYYTTEELTILGNRLKRIRKQDSSIKELPRFGIINSLEKLDIEINLFLIENSIEIEKTTLFEIFQKEPIYKPKKPKDIKEKKSWWKFW